MTDESAQPYPSDMLLDRGLRPEGFYGAFAVDMHIDFAPSSGSDEIIAV
jgi:hypothetical protein